MATLADGLAALWARLPPDARALSTGTLGGGLGHAGWVVNAQVPGGYARTDPGVHLREIAAELGLEGQGVGMLTAASVREVRVAECDGAVALVTVRLAGEPERRRTPSALPAPQRRCGGVRRIGVGLDRAQGKVLGRSWVTALHARGQTRNVRV